MLILLGAPEIPQAGHTIIGYDWLEFVGESSSKARQPQPCRLGSLRASPNEEPGC